MSLCTSTRLLLLASAATLAAAAWLARPVEQGADSATVRNLPTSSIVNSVHTVLPAHGPDQTRSAAAAQNALPEPVALESKGTGGVTFEATACQHHISVVSDFDQHPSARAWSLVIADEGDQLAEKRLKIGVEKELSTVTLISARVNGGNIRLIYHPASFVSHLALDCIGKQGSTLEVHMPPLTPVTLYPMDATGTVADGVHVTLVRVIDGEWLSADLRATPDGAWHGEVVPGTYTAMVRGAATKVLRQEIVIEGAPVDQILDIPTTDRLEITLVPLRDGSSAPITQEEFQKITALDENGRTVLLSRSGRIGYDDMESRPLPGERRAQRADWLAAHAEGFREIRLVLEDRPNIEIGLAGQTIALGQLDRHARFEFELSH